MFQTNIVHNYGQMTFVLPSTARVSGIRAILLWALKNMRKNMAKAQQGTKSFVYCKGVWRESCQEVCSHCMRKRVIFCERYEKCNGDYFANFLRRNLRKCLQQVERPTRDYFFKTIVPYRTIPRNSKLATCMKAVGAK